MITPTLQFITDALNSFMQNRFALSETIVLLSPLNNADGTQPPESENKVLVTLLNLEMNANQALGNNLPGHHQLVPPANFEITFIVSTRFPDYAKALKFCDAVASFFQANPVLDRSAFPSMPAEVDPLKVVFQSLSLQEMQDLWRDLGVSYQPSMVYRVVGWRWLPVS